MNQHHFTSCVDGDEITLVPLSQEQQIKRLEKMKYAKVRMLKNQQIAQGRLSAFRELLSFLSHYGARHFVKDKIFKEVDKLSEIEEEIRKIKRAIYHTKTL